MSKVTCKRWLILVSIAGSQIPGLVFWAVTSKASNEPCVYQWGDVNRAADKAGYEARLWFDNPNHAQAPEESADLPSTGNAVGISGNTEPAAAAAAAPDVPRAVAPYSSAYRGESIEGMSLEAWQIGQDEIARLGNGNGMQSGGPN